MSKGLSGVKTLTAKQIADKWKLPLGVVAKKIAAGVKVEKEHTNSTSQANEIARDHLGERPDYYDKLHKMEKTKIVKEDTGVGGVRGLGLVSGDPAGVTDYISQYINTNTMSYEDENGNKLNYIKKQHLNLHNSNLGYTAFNPKNIGANKNFNTIKEERLNELGEYDNKGGTSGAEGLTDPSPKIYRKNEMAENDLKDACWKGYTAKGLKKKGSRMVPNCVPVEEQGYGIVAKPERPMYEKSTPGAMPSTVERGIYEDEMKEDWQSVNRKDKTDGLSQKAVNAYRRENPGSKLKTAVTEKNPTGKRASRRKSFCSRMGGMKKRLTSAKTARDPDSRINKALRRWNCEEQTQINELKAETLGSYIKKAAKSRQASLNTGTNKVDIKTWGKRQKGITAAVKKLTHVDEQSPSHIHLNKPDVTYAPGASGTTHTIHEETKMENKILINEAIENILENDLSAMKENLMTALQEKAMEKLEERKKEISANYFAQ